MGLKGESLEGMIGMKDIFVMAGWASRLVRSNAWQKAAGCFVCWSPVEAGAGATTISIEQLYCKPRE